MEETPVLSALDGGVLTLTLNRPQRLNAMSNALIEAMNARAARAPRTIRPIRAVLLTGTGRGFCAGADLAGGGTVDASAKAAARPRRHHGPPLQSDDPRHARSAQADRRRDQRRGGGRRRQLRARLRHRPGRALGPLRPGLRAHLADARSRRHLVPAAHRGRRPRPRARHAGHVGAGRGGRAHGHDLAGRRRRGADGRGDQRSPAASRPVRRCPMPRSSRRSTRPPPTRSTSSSTSSATASASSARAPTSRKGVAAFLAKRAATIHRTIRR